MTAQKLKFSRILDTSEMSEDAALLELNEALARNESFIQKGSYTSKKDFLLISGSPYEKIKSSVEFEIITDPADSRVKDRCLYARDKDGKYYVITQDAIYHSIPQRVDAMIVAEEDILTKFPTWRSDNWRRRGVPLEASNYTLLGISVKYPLLSDGKEFSMPVYR
jgi:hypothetical protein